MRLIFTNLGERYELYRLLKNQYLIYIKYCKKLTIIHTYYFSKYPVIASQDQLVKYHNFLAKQALFKDIEENDLIDFIQSLHIKQYQKGEIVTFNDQEHANLYIVYDGLLKLTKTNEKGDEVVLSIFDKNDAVTPMYYSPYYDVCVEFVKDTTMFYFTETDVKHFIRQNHAFSNNIIKFLADSVQALMISAEVLQLNTAKEKVGWYLAHAKINNTFELPYSKVLIASYLGIKPESFSRALAELKKEGIVLKNKKINLVNGDELCKYCDRVTGSSCSLFQTEACAHN